MGPPSGCATQVTITVDTSQSAVQMDTSIITRTTPSVRKYNTERYIITGIYMSTTSRRKYCCFLSN